MRQAAIFDVDGTLVDSVDLHARAWQKALARFGHPVTFAQCRSQIGKGGDQFLPVFLSAAAQKDHDAEMAQWRGKLFKAKYLPLVRPFSAVPELLRQVRDAGLKIAVASSAKTNELDVYLDIAGIRDLVDEPDVNECARNSQPVGFVKSRSPPNGKSSTCRKCSIGFSSPSSSFPPRSWFGTG